MHTTTKPNPPTREQLKQFWQLAKAQNLDGAAFGRLLEFLPPLLAAAQADSLPPRNEYLDLLGRQKETPFFCEVSSSRPHWVSQHSAGELLRDLEFFRGVRLHGHCGAVCGVRNWIEAKRNYRGVHPPIQVTEGVTYRLGLIFGCEFKSRARTNGHVFAEMARRGLRKPPAEVGLYLRRRLQASLLDLANKVRPEECPELKLWDLWQLVVMHEPLPDGEGGTHLLNLYGGSDGEQGLSASSGSHESGYSKSTLFVTLLPDEPAQPQGA